MSSQDPPTPGDGAVMSGERTSPAARSTSPAGRSTPSAARSTAQAALTWSGVTARRMARKDL